MTLLKGKKTVILNGVIGLLMLLKVMLPDAELPTPEDIGLVIDNVDALLVSLFALINIMLRASTTTAIWEKD